MFPKTGRSTNYLQTILVYSQSISQPPYKQANFRATRSSVQMRFIKNHQELFVNVFFEPSPRRVENRALNRPHQHVFEH